MSKYLKSHNDYRVPKSEQVTEALRVFKMANHNTHALCTIPFDDLIVEADIIQMFGKIRLAHSKSYNPLTWIGITEWFFKLIAEIYVLSNWNIFRNFTKSEYEKIKSHGWSGRWHGTLDEYLKKCEKYGVKYVQIDIKEPWSVVGEDVAKIVHKYLNIEIMFSGFKTITFAQFASENEITSIDLY
jgi:hypothetical protein